MTNKLQKIILAGTIGIALAGTGCESAKPLYPYHTADSYKEIRLKAEKKNEFRNERIKNAHYFACNEYIDLNGNDSEDYPMEFISIKSKFRAGEEMMLVAYNFPKSWQMEEMKIYSPSGKLVYNMGLRQWKEGSVMKVRMDSKKLAKENGLGKYNVAWLLDGKPAGKTSFELAE